MPSLAIKRTAGCLLVGLAGVCLLLALALSLFGALVGTLFGSSAGGGPCAHSSATPTPDGHHGGDRAFPLAASSPSPHACLPPNKIAAAVVSLAEQMANALYVNPSCGGIISYPNCYYTWYTSAFPPSVIAYGNQVCPGCAAWANGTYQCVSFVRGAYGPIYPMIWTANAFDLWATYQGKPGWSEIPSAEAPPGQRGMPLPGDVMVFKDNSIGHVAIVISVQPPANGQDGAITFANANSVSPYTTMPLLPDLSVDSSSWPGYTVWGYLRPAGSRTGTPITFTASALPFLPTIDHPEGGHSSYDLVFSLIGTCSRCDRDHSAIL